MVVIKDATPAVVDAVAYVNPQKHTLSTRVLINLPANDFGDDGVRAQFVLIHPDGERKSFGSREIVARQSGLWTKQVAGLTQCAVECEYRLPAITDVVGYAVEVTLLSATDESLDIAVQPVKLSGVLSEANQMAVDGEINDSENDLESMSLNQDTQGSNYPNRGILSRIFSRR